MFTTRALHLGHSARSFALKKPPTQLATNWRKDAVVDENESANKRNSHLAFEGQVLDPTIRVAKKRQLTAATSTNKKQGGGNY